MPRCRMTHPSNLRPSKRELSDYTSRWPLWGRWIPSSYLIRMGDFYVSEKIWILFVCLVRNVCILVRIERSYSERLHTTSDFESSCIESFLFKKNAQSSWSKEWMFGVENIESFQNSFSFWIYDWRVVITGSRYPEEFSLTRDGNERKIHVYGRKFPLMVTFLQAVYIFLSQSRSIVSWPICRWASSSASSFSRIPSSFFLGSANIFLLRSMKSVFQLDAIVGYRECFDAISTSVAVLERTSNTTLVLNSDVYLFRAFVIMVFKVRDIMNFS